MQTHACFKLSPILQRILMAILILMSSIISFAQETKKVDVDINADNGGFFGSPWVWVVGVAVFILLLVALMRGGSRKDT